MKFTNDLHKPERYYNVSHTQMSIARYYGGIRVNGVAYVYDPTKDELIRSDVLKREQKAKREKEKFERIKKKSFTKKHLELF